MATKRKREDEHLPTLTSTQFQILLVLLDGERHGYGIVKDLRARSGGRVRLEPGNLYRFLRRLIEMGLVTEAGRRAPSESSNDRRRYYVVTEAGKRALDEEGRRMRSLVEALEKRRPGTPLESS